MLDEIFIVIIFTALALTYRWAFRTLPNEDWQIMGCFPYGKSSSGYWQGWNLTWYGFFNATAILFAVSVAIILLGSLSAPLIPIMTILVLLLLVCLWTGKMLAFLIEKKRNTATVGGASFMGIIIAPFLLFLLKITGNHFLDFNISIIAILSVMAIAYAFGEGIGRLACISFGCCYGKPLKTLSSHLQNVFNRYSFTFTGKTKKIAYAHALDGEKVVPVQAMTTLIYSLTGLMGCYFFLKGFVSTAFVMTLTVTQIWRFLSEFLRADYRGEGKISVYQTMSLISCLYAFAVTYIFHEAQIIKPDLILGLSMFWNPGLFFFLMILWIVVLFYTGKSRVTFSLIQVKVDEKEI
ncbi:MAG: prolipoprotein diacylglyceryl transferase family protein [Smithella sp.]